MDILTLDNSTYTATGVVSDVDSVLWVERYLEPGEFKIVCEPSPKLRTQLALGTLISHMDTPEVMMVENHEISETLGSSSKLEVTGRSLDAFLEKRIISNAGTPAYNRTNKEVNDIVYNATPSAIALYLLTAYTLGSSLTSNNILPNISVIADSAIPTVSAVQRSFKKGTNLRQAIVDVLGSQDLGIRFERPLRDKAGNFVHHYNSTTDPNALKMCLYIHAGVDQSASVTFFYDAGDIQDAKYLWSIKDELNCINGSTYYVEVTSYFPFVTPPSGWGNKTGYVDVTKINQDPGLPTSAATALQQAAIIQEATELYSKSKPKSFMEATISKNSRYAYRKDYIVGDIVYVVGNYGVSQKMRVIENVEVQDATGSFSYPTLKVL